MSCGTWACPFEFARNRAAGQARSLAQHGPIQGTAACPKESSPRFAQPLWNCARCKKNKTSARLHCGNQKCSVGGRRYSDGLRQQRACGL